MNKETKVQLVKVATGIIASVSVAAVGTAVLNKVIPFDEATKIEKVILKIGATIVVSMLADQGSAYAANLVGNFMNPSEPTGSLAKAIWQ